MAVTSQKEEMVIEKLRTGEEEGGGMRQLSCVWGGVEDHTPQITPPLIQQSQQEKS